ncbi:hypothetical protein ACP4OV_007910 [Aristida adscensionis]
MLALVDGFDWPAVTVRVATSASLIVIAQHLTHRVACRRGRREASPHRADLEYRRPRSPWGPLPTAAATLGEVDGKGDDKWGSRIEPVVSSGRRRTGAGCGERVYVVFVPTNGMASGGGTLPAAPRRACPWRQDRDRRPRRKAYIPRKLILPEVVRTVGGHDLELEPEFISGTTLIRVKARVAAPPADGSGRTDVLMTMGSVFSSREDAEESAADALIGEIRRAYGDVDVDDYNFGRLRSVEGDTRVFESANRMLTYWFRGAMDLMEAIAAACGDIRAEAARERPDAGGIGDAACALASWIGSIVLDGRAALDDLQDIIS